MRKLSIIAIALWSLAACSKEEPAVPAGAHFEIRIAGEIGQTDPQSNAQSCLSRASETAFAAGDRIGLRVEYNNSVVGHRNALLTHNGNVFTGRRLMWDESATDAVLWACHPYVAGDDIPTTFDVIQNQRTDEAFAQADFLAACRSVTVEEFAEPVKLQFRHVLSKVIFNITDETEAKNVVIDHIRITDFKRGVVVTYAEPKCEAAMNPAAMSAPANITSHRIENLKHEVILAPQKAESMMIEIYTPSNEGVALRYKKRAKKVELESGFRYKVNITLKDGEGEEVIEFAAAAEVEPWEDETVLPDTQV